MQLTEGAALPSAPPKVTKGRGINDEERPPLIERGYSGATLQKGRRGSLSLRDKADAVVAGGDVGGAAGISQ